MENKFTKPIWFPATFVLTCSLFINSALYAFTLEAGQNLNSRELAQYQLSSPIKVGEITVREFINPSVPDANKTFVVIPASGLVGVSKNEVIVSGLELASLNKVTNSFTAEIEQKSHQDLTQTTVIKAKSLVSAVRIRDEIKRNFPTVKLSLPIQFTSKRSR